MTGGKKIEMVHKPCKEVRMVLVETRNGLYDAIITVIGVQAYVGAKKLANN